MFELYAFSARKRPLVFLLGGRVGVEEGLTLFLPTPYLCSSLRCLLSLYQIDTQEMTLTSNQNYYINEKVEKLQKTKSKKVQNMVLKLWSVKDCELMLKYHYYRNLFEIETF